MAETTAPPSPFEKFSRTHALAQWLALGGGVWLHSAVPATVAAVGAFAAYFWDQRGRYTPRGNFGLANLITGLRAGLALLLALPRSSLPPTTTAALATAILVLDGVDGPVARRRGDASAFGAHFDMETDALFVLMVTLRLWLQGGYGAWVLTAGLLRYAYVLAVWLVPGPGREAPRSLLGRLAFLALALGLIAGLALPGVVGRVSVLAGTLVVSASFARSYYFSYFAT